MCKNIVISILAGIIIARWITLPDAQGRWVIVLGLTMMMLMAILKLEDLWDKRQRILRIIHRITSAVLKSIRQILKNADSWIRWHLIQLKCWPIEMAQRQRRRQMMLDYIRRIQDMQPGERYPIIGESEEQAWKK